MNPWRIFQVAYLMTSHYLDNGSINTKSLHTDTVPQKIIYVILTVISKINPRLSFQSSDLIFPFSYHWVLVTFDL